MQHELQSECDWICRWRSRHYDWLSDIVSNARVWPAGITDRVIHPQTEDRR